MSPCDYVLLTIFSGPQLLLRVECRWRRLPNHLVKVRDVPTWLSLSCGVEALPGLSVTCRGPPSRVADENILLPVPRREHLAQQFGTLELLKFSKPELFREQPGLMSVPGTAHVRQSSCAHAGNGPVMFCRYLMMIHISGYVIHSSRPAQWTKITRMWCIDPPAESSIWCACMRHYVPCYMELGVVPLSWRQLAPTSSAP